MAPSLWQILIVVVLIFLLFGAGKMPRVMGDIAEGIKSFKKGLKDEDETKDTNTTEKIPGQKD